VVAAEIDALARAAVDCGFRLHRDLGPGLLESAYETLMFESLRREGFAVARQVVVPLRYDGIVVDAAFRADLIVEDNLLIEIKSVERSAPVHGKQVLTYLRLLGMPLGLLMNFGLPTLKEGVRRIANDFRD
jgi:GxxExxY protein